MSFVRLGSTPRFTCVAADAKPTTGIEIGSTSYETDTGKLFIFNGAAWVEKATDVRLTGSNVVVDAVIAQNGTVSTEIDFRNYKYLSFLMPASWDAATLTIKGSMVAGGTKVDIVNDAGVVFPAMTVAADKLYSVDLHALKVAGVPYLAFVASAPQTTAARTIKVGLKA